MIKEVGRAENIIGNKYGMLTVLARAEDYKYGNNRIKTRWLCKCNYGNEVIVGKNALVSGDTISCGCIKKINGYEKFLKENNNYDTSGEYGIGYDSSGNKFYFDLDKFNVIKDFYWFVNSKGYVQNSNGKLLHNFLFPDYLIVDHINHKKFDNRSSNLRNVTGSQNMMNRSKGTNNTSGYVGVVWHKKDHRWQAQIVVNQKNIYLGQYQDINDAIRARKKAEEKYFGEYSYDNSMKKDEV